MKIKYSAILLSVNLFAGVVNPNFAYQDYLDFGNNKGKFKVGNNIEVTDIYGKTIDFKVPMPSFNAANTTGDLMGELTNIGGSFAITAAHMISPKYRPDLIQKDKEYEFGLVKSKVVASDTNFKDYFKWNKSCDELVQVDDLKDFAVIKMSKLNINESAKLIDKEFYFKNTNVKDNLKNDQNVIYQDKYFAKNSIYEWDTNAYKEYIKTSGEKDDNNIGKGEILNNPERFSVYARTGSGIQKIGSIDTSIFPKQVANFSEFLTGGVLYINEDESKRETGYLHLSAKDYYKDIRLDFSNTSAPGDSGSAIYVWDNLKKEWLVVGVVSRSNCGDNNTTCSYTKYALINSFIINDFKNDFTATLNGSNYSSNDIYSNIKDKYNENNKDLVFSKAASIALNNNENFGSSVFYFKDNSTLNGEEVLLGGVVIDDGKTLKFNAKTAANDNLHRMGKGTLEISKESAGGLRSGEGLTILNTSNKAFSSIYLLNNAGLKITNANQINNANLVFNGGYLDLNGVDLSFDKIQANDFRTKIINSNSKKSTLSINNTNDIGIYHGQISDNIDLKLNNSKTFVFDGEIKADELSVNGGTTILQGHPLEHSYFLNQSLANSLGVNTAPNTNTQDEYENRTSKINNINLSNSTFKILKHSNLTSGNITLDKSNLSIGENLIYLDRYDANHINSSLVFTSFANEFNSIAKDIEVTANVKLKNNSTLSIMNNSNFSGSIITEDNNSILKLNNANIDANINVANLNASKTNFMFSLNNTLISSISTLGGQNTFMIKPDLANANKFLLASLVNTNNTINNDYLKALDYKENISIYTPNVEFVNENGKANWYLVKVNKEDIENTTPIVPETKPEIKPEPTKPNDDLNKPSVKDYFFVQENKEVTQMIDSSLNQVFFSYVLEWNNLQKRMGELRNNTDANAGIWFRAYTGQSSYEHANKTKFYEMQLGADKLNQGNNYVNYTGLIFNASKYSLSDNLDGSIKGYGFGAYSSTIYDNGLYFDVIAKYINYKNDFNLYVKNQNEVTNSLKPNNSYTFLASAEIGYRKDFNNFYLEPQIELITGYVSKQELTSSDKKLYLQSDSFIPLNLKTAIFTGFNKNDLSLRAGVGLASDLVNNSKKTIKDLDTISINNGKRDSRVFVNLSSSYRLNNRSNIGLEFEKTFGGNLNIDYSFNLVYRYNF